MTAADDARFSSLDAVVDSALANGVMTAASYAVVVGDTIVHLRGRGRTGAEEDLPAADDETIFDLASLTKVLSTTLLSAVAIVDGRLTLDERPFEPWPEATIADVLAHCAGLVPWVPAYQDAIAHRVVGLPAGRDCVLERLEREPARAPGATAYSDLGFIALGVLLEERLGDRLDRVFADAARAHYGDTNLTYVPLYECGYHPEIRRVAQTEGCLWRGRFVHGQVHDDNCFAMGGIAGHAGLFGSVHDVATAACFFLRAVRDGGEDNAVADVIRDFARHDGDRPLGFDRATDGGSTGEALSAQAIGHLGFTGTSLWVDPAGADGAGSAYVLLTNRVHMGREKLDGIRKLRRAFHQEAARLVDV